MAPRKLKKTEKRRVLPLGMMITSVTDPSNIGALIPAMRRAMHPLDHALARGRINHRQHSGFLRYQALCDACAGSFPSSGLGGGGASSGATDAGSTARMVRHLWASKNLSAMQAHLGKRASHLAHAVITCGISSYALAEKIDGCEPSSRTKQVIFAQVAHMLDDCASFVLPGVDQL